MCNNYNKKTGYRIDVELSMEIVLNGAETVVVEDNRTARGYRMINCSMNTLNPTNGLTVFIENPQVGAHPWVSYVRLDEDGRPDLSSRPVTRMPLSKSIITSIKT
jgi:hypothetical protein